MSFHWKGGPLCRPAAGKVIAKLVEGGLPVRSEFTKPLFIRVTE